MPCDACIFFNACDSSAMDQELDTAKVIAVFLDKRIGDGHNKLTFGQSGYRLAGTRLLLANYDRARKRIDLSN